MPRLDRRREADGQFLAAWFGGKAEKAKDVQIWASRFDGTAWSAPEVVGTEPGQPTWNPVLFRAPSGTLKLWYKAGPDPVNWTGFVRASDDHGKTWAKPELLPAGFFGPVRAKPIALADGTILAGTSVEAPRLDAVRGPFHRRRRHLDPLERLQR